MISPFTLPLSASRIRFLGFSAGVLLAERIRPWRDQPLVRPHLGKDVFWYGFNGFLVGSPFVLGWLLGPRGWERRLLAASFHHVTGRSVTDMRLAAGLPLWLQMILVLLAADFLEWVVHNGLHRLPVLWRFHRVHHSIHVMDWIGNYRFHWAELIVYQGVKYLPLALLGVRPRAWVLYLTLLPLIGMLNHSNLNLSWGPLRYVLNSPRMHLWHHDKQVHGVAGVNFGVVLSCWDWLFRTAYFPADPVAPARLGFPGDDRLPEHLVWRFFLPFLDRPALPTPPSDDPPA